MNEPQRRGRAELIRDNSPLLLLTLYATSFLGVSAAIDIWDLVMGDETAARARYLIPLLLALAAWGGLRAWADRVLSHPSVTAGV
jgi:hypothetical protein